MIVAVDARKRAFSAALPFHVSAQIAEHRITAFALLTRKAGPRETCRTKEKNYHENAFSRSVVDATMTRIIFSQFSIPI